MAKYQFYISYNHRDGSTIAQWTKKELIERGYTVFMDEGLSVGSDWMQAIAEAIADCDAFIPIITDGFLTSPSAIREVGSAGIFEIYLKYLNKRERNNKFT